MRLAASAPVTWPAPDRLDAWWREQLADLTRTSVDADGYLVDPAAPSGEDRVRLVRGTHLVPGASYVVESPALNGVEVRGEVVGTPERRGLRAVVRGERRALGLRRATEIAGHLDGLDRLEQVDVTSTHPHLRGSLRFSPHPAELLRVRLRLRWLAVDVDAAVVDDALDARLHLGARGLWSPAVAPVVAVIGRLARGAMQDAVSEWAETLTAIAEDREPAAEVRRREWERDERERREDEATALWVREQVVRRFATVQDHIDRQGWWGRRGGAWRRAHADLPSVRWPERRSGRPSWDEAVDEAVQRLSRRPRTQRREAVETEADQVVWSELLGRREPRPDLASGPEALRAEDLELSWLRSPWTVWAHLRRAGAVTPEDERAMPSPAPGSPGPPGDTP